MILGYYTGCTLDFSKFDLESYLLNRFENLIRRKL